MQDTRELFIDVKPNGNLFSLYHDDLPLTDLGTFEVSRASVIEFCQVKKQWVVLIDNVIVFSASKRSECIDYEIEYIQKGNTGCFAQV